MEANLPNAGEVLAIMMILLSFWVALSIIYYEE